MANIKSQKKRIITNEKARMRNRAVRSELKTAIRVVREAVEAKDGATAYAAALAAAFLLPLEGATFFSAGLYAAMSSAVTTVLASFITPLLRFAAWRLWIMPLDAALSSRRHALRAAASAEKAKRREATLKAEKAAADKKAAEAAAAAEAEEAEEAAE